MMRNYSWSTCLEWKSDDGSHSRAPITFFRRWSDNCWRVCARSLPREVGKSSLRVAVASRLWALDSHDTIKRIYIPCWTVHRANVDVEAACSLSRLSIANRKTTDSMHFFLNIFRFQSRRWRCSIGSLFGFCWCACVCKTVGKTNHAWMTHQEK